MPGAGSPKIPMAMTNDSPYKTMSQKVAYKTPWLQVREDAIIHPDGQEGVYSVMEIPGCAVVLPFTDDNRLLLVRLWRYPLAAWSWELPMGRVDNGESSLVAAKRELKEETGVAAADWQELGSFTSMNGFSNGWLTAFAATGLSGEASPKDTEISQVEAFSMTDIHTMIDRQQLFDGETMTSLWLAQRKGLL